MQYQNPPLHRFTLNNGLRVAWLETHAPVASAGLMVGCGSSFENQNMQEEGMAHFVEHMVFKGTHRRQAHHILSRMDEVGGDLNAYTTKEQTFYYATFLKEHMARALDLLADMVTQPTFLPKEIEKERSVILDEYHTAMDDPIDALGEWFDESLFQNHPLGHSILGTPQTLEKVDQNKLFDWHNTFYNATNMVLVLTGDYRPAKIKYWAEKFFSHIIEGKRPNPPHFFKEAARFSKQTQKAVQSAYVMTGRSLFGLYDARRLPMFLLNNMLGGPGMNSRFNMGIREKYGLTYFLESQYSPFQSGGSWAVAWAAPDKKTKRVNELIWKELNRFVEKPLGPVQWHKAKTQLKGQLALSNASSSHLLHVIARSILVFNALETLPETFEKIDAIQPGDIQDLAKEVFDRDAFCMYCIRPLEDH